MQASMVNAHTTWISEIKVAIQTPLYSNYMLI